MVMDWLGGGIEALGPPISAVAMSLSLITITEVVLLLWTVRGLK